MPDYGNGGDFTVTMDGPFASSVGNEGKLLYIYAPTANWKGGTSPYSQVVMLENINENSKIDIQISSDQMELLKGQTIAFTTENRSGVVTLIAFGDKPAVDCVFQAVASDVQIIGDSDESVIRGNLITTNMPRSDFLQEDESEADFIKNKPLKANQNNTWDMNAALNMNGQKLTGLNEPTAEADAVNLGFVKKAAPWNALDNSNFRNLIAQSGVGGKHGTATYAADRWYLKSGTVSYEQGIGLTLNGTILQMLGTTVTEGSAFVGMHSGTAEIFFDEANQKVEITSNGGVLAWAALYPGSYTDQTRPEYHPKDYAVELATCMQYYVRFESSTTESMYVGSGVFNSSKKTAYIGLDLQVPMRKRPAVAFNNMELWNGSMGHQSVQNMIVYGSDIKIQKLSLKCDIATAVDTPYTASLQTPTSGGGALVLNADIAPV